MELGLWYNLKGWKTKGRKITDGKELPVLTMDVIVCPILTAISHRQILLQCNYSSLHTSTSGNCQKTKDLVSICHYNKRRRQKTWNQNLHLLQTLITTKQDFPQPSTYSSTLFPALPWSTLSAHFWLLRGALDLWSRMKERIPAIRQHV
jgi:hypothetical protein